MTYGLFKLTRKSVIFTSCLAFFLGILLFSTNAYAFKVVDQGISKMAPNSQDSNNFEKLTEFPQDWPIVYYWVKYTDASVGDKIVAKFQYIDQEPTTFSEVSDVADKASELLIVHAALNPGKSWPKGKYEVVLLVNDKELSTLEYEVK
ncbi:hypothetical protein V4762_05685 [Thermodesulfobium sp. 4217-1]|uniref:hypothetical protein n=1 Tax=Thermodesulfobium sp. 4217-1 TaxID=3120013 RepID=UPI003221D59D